MYFRNRADAGRKLAAKMGHLKQSNVSVVALSEGGAIVGAQIAMQLHGNMMLLLTEKIKGILDLQTDLPPVKFLYTIIKDYQHLTAQQL